MPTYDVDVDGSTYEVDAPDERTAWQWANQFHVERAASPGGTGYIGPKGAAPAQTDMRPALAGLVQGFRNPLDAAAQLAERGSGGALRTLNARLGLPGADEARLSARQGIADFFGAEPSPTGEAVGGMLATLPMGAMGTTGGKLVPALAKGAALGAGFGALQPVESGDFAAEKGRQIGTGAMAGAAGTAAARGAARVIFPNASRDTALLRSEGVMPMPGQALGGGWKRAEEKLLSVPLVGDAAAASMRRGIEQFDRAAINRALKPIGEKLPADVAVGREAIAYMQRAASKAYDKAVNGLVVRADAQFGQEMASLRQMAQSMHPDRIKQLDAIIDMDVLRRMTPQGNASGVSFKTIDEALGKRARMYANAADPDARELGAAVQEAKRIVRELARRNDPQRVAAIDAADETWANLVRVEKAAAMQGAKDGVFTPAQLGFQVRMSDPSMRKRAFGRGDALMQDLSDAGQRVLSNTYPDSGTAGRMAFMAALGGTAYDPVTAMTLGAAGTALYSPAVSGLLGRAVASRPPGAEAFAEAVRNRAAPFALPLLTPSLLGVQQ